jgi:hypothetical protein
VRQFNDVLVGRLHTLGQVRAHLFMELLAVVSSEHEHDVEELGHCEPLYVLIDKLDHR